MFKQPSNYDSHAFPPSLTFSSAFASALVIGVILFGTVAVTLTA
jgi:hypothetical protein